MKKLYIVAVPLVVTAVIVGVTITRPKQEDVKVTTSVVETQAPVIETSPVTAPEAPQATETVETTITQTQAGAVAVEPENAEPYTVAEIGNYIRSNHEPNLAQAIYGVFLSNQAIFMNDKDSAINACVEVYEQNSPKMPYQLTRLMDSAVKQLAV